MEDRNPYAAPTAELRSETDPAAFALQAPRSLSPGRGWAWIVAGFGLFRASPGAWILTLLAGFGILIALSLIPLLGQLALAATYYVWLGGIMLGCHAQAKGAPFEVKYLFEGFNRQPKKLIVLSSISAVASILIMMAIMGPVYMEILNSSTGDVDQQVLDAVLDPVSFWLRILFAMAIMLPLAMAVWFAPALICLHDLPVIDAMKLSFFGCLKNVLPFLIYGIAAIVLYILAIIPLALGLLVVLPTLGASIYASYREIFTAGPLSA